MIYCENPLCNKFGFSLHDCIATDMVWENGDLTFFFPKGVAMGEALTPKGRHLNWAQSTPAKLTFIGADPAYFYVCEPWEPKGGYLHTEVTWYDLPEVITKVSSEEWRIEFIEEYRNFHSNLYHCILLQKSNNDGRDPELIFALDYEQLVCEWNEE